MEGRGFWSEGQQQTSDILNRDVNKNSRLDEKDSSKDSVRNDAQRSSPVSDIPSSEDKGSRWSGVNDDRKDEIKGSPEKDENLTRLLSDTNATHQGEGRTDNYGRDSDRSTSSSQREGAARIGDTTDLQGQSHFAGDNLSIGDIRRSGTDNNNVPDPYRPERGAQESQGKNLDRPYGNDNGPDPYRPEYDASAGRSKLGASDQAGTKDLSSRDIQISSGSDKNLQKGSSSSSTQGPSIGSSAPGIGLMP